MAHSAANLVISELRERIQHLEGPSSRPKRVLPFDIPDIDDRLPGGGLAYGALHEFAGGGAGTVDGAAAALFVAGIAARTKGQIVWCLARPDLFFPALAQAGLHPKRVVFVESRQRGRRHRQHGGGLGIWRPWCCGRRAGAVADDQVAAASACRREVWNPGVGRQALATTDGSQRLRPADGVSHAVAGECHTERKASCSRRRSSTVVVRTHKSESGRVR